jgi:hypothetical protein
LQPGQRGLTPEQEAEARRFAEASIQRHLSTEPVDEEETEAFLWQAYEAAGLTPPHHIHWLDGPLELVAALAREYEWIEVDDVFTERVSYCVWDDLRREGSEITRSLREAPSKSIDGRVRSVQRLAEASIQHRLGLRKGVKHAARAWNLIASPTLESVQIAVGEHLAREVAGSFKHPDSDGPWDPDRIWSQESAHETCRWHSICAYDEAVNLAYLHYFDTYAVPNQAHGLAHFNERVGGYWLGKEVALLVRRPKVLSRDAAGRLHSETGKCIEFRDGWGCYAWHGVRVDEKVILAPETLTRQDWTNARNTEVRRLIQERMGQRFIWELGGRVINTGPRGTLYEVCLSTYTPKQVARYVQVQDASSEREYFLRVPPTIQTAAEAVAWSFGLSVEAYDPAQET